MRCHYQGCMLVRVFVFPSVCLCAMGNRLVFMPMKGFTHFQSFRPPTYSLFLSLLLQSSCCHFFFLSLRFILFFSVIASLHLHFVLTSPLLLSFSYPLLSTHPRLACPPPPPLLPPPCQHCHSLGSPSVCYRPLTASSLYGTFSF